MRTLLVATGSANKLAELQRLFARLPLTLVTLRDLKITEEAPESGATFEENALQKAHFYAAASGEWTLAGYKIVKKKLLTRVSTSPTLTQQVGQRSAAGLETSVSFQLSPAWSLDANGTVLKAGEVSACGEPSR